MPRFMARATGRMQVSPIDMRRLRRGRLNSECLTDIQEYVLQRSLEQSSKEKPALEINIYDPSLYK